MVIFLAVAVPLGTTKKYNFSSSYDIIKIFLFDAFRCALVMRRYKGGFYDTGRVFILPFFVTGE